MIMTGETGFGSSDTTSDPEHVMSGADSVRVVGGHARTGFPAHFTGGQDDVNGDGVADLIVSSTGVVDVLFGGNSNVFAAGSVVDVSTDPTLSTAILSGLEGDARINFGDVNLDGITDILLSTASQKIVTFTMTGKLKKGEALFPEGKTNYVVVGKPTAKSTLLWRHHKDAESTQGRMRHVHYLGKG